MLLFLCLLLTNPSISTSCDPPWPSEAPQGQTRLLQNSLLNTAIWQQTGELYVGGVSTGTGMPLVVRLNSSLQEVWRVENITASGGVVNAVSVGDSLDVFGSFNESLFINRINITTGSTISHTSWTSNSTITAAQTFSGFFVLTGYESNTTGWVERRDYSGGLIWHTSFPFQPLSFCSSLLLLGTNSTLTSLSLSSGQVLQSTAIRGNVTHVLCLSNTSVVLGCNDGTVVHLVQGVENWVAHVEHPVKSLVQCPRSGNVLALSSSGASSVLTRLASGVELWKITIGSSSSSLAASPDGIFALIASGAMVRRVPVVWYCSEGHGIAAECGDVFLPGNCSSCPQGTFSSIGDGLCIPCPTECALQCDANDGSCWEGDDPADALTFETWAAEDMNLMAAGATAVVGGGVLVALIIMIVCKCRSKEVRIYPV